MSLLNREALLKKTKLIIKKVDLGEMGHVFVKEMNGAEKDRFEQSIIEIDKKTKQPKTKLENYRAKLLVNTICDANGNLILNIGDVKALNENNGAVMLDKLLEESQKLNSISENDKEELVKN